MTKLRFFGYWAAFVGATGGFLQNYAISAIAGALLFIEKEFSLSPEKEGLAASIILLGALVGSLFAGSLADRYGRRTALCVASLIFLGSSLPFLFVTHFSVFILLRFLSGLAAGITSIICPLYLAEIAPSSLRGAFVTAFQFFITLGMVVAYVVNFAAAESGHWRFMLFFTAIPAALQASALFFVPESPRWLVGIGKVDQGAAVLQSLHAEDDLSFREKKPLAKSDWRELLSPALRKALFIGASLVLLQQGCGITAIAYFTPKLIQRAGFSEIKAAIGITLALGITNSLITLLSLFLIDRLGRRTLLLWSQGGVALSLSLFTATFFVPGRPVLAVLTLVAFLIAFALGLGSIPWVLISEIYPLRIRARAIGIMLFLSWLSCFLIVFAFPRFLAFLGPAWTFTLYTAIACFGWGLFYRIIPETKGKTFEEIETALYR